MLWDSEEVTSTLRMIETEHLDIRTTTMGISLRDCVTGDLGETCGDDEGGRVDSAGESRGQRKGNRQTVRKADHRVSHDEAGGEMLLDVRHGRHDSSPATLSRQAAGPRYRASGRSSRFPHSLHDRS